LSGLQPFWRNLLLKYASQQKNCKNTKILTRTGLLEPRELGLELLKSTFNAENFICR